MWLGVTWIFVLPPTVANLKELLTTKDTKVHEGNT